MAKSGNKSLGDVKKDVGFFRGKAVLCNCGSPCESDFFCHFAPKKLIATCDDASPVAYTQLDLLEGDFSTETLRRRNGRGCSTSVPTRHERHVCRIVIIEVKDENGNGMVDIATSNTEDIRAL